MTTKQNVENNFRSAMAQAAKIDEIAESLAAVSDKKLGNTLQELSLGWKGENASAYLRKGAKLQDRMGNSSMELRGIAEDIRSRAKRIYESE